MTKKLLLFAFLFLISFVSFSQEKTLIINGCIKDSLNTPIPFASIILSKEKSKTIASFTTSNSKGKFQLKAKKISENYILTIRSLSFEKKEITIKKEDFGKEKIDINVNLRSKITKLNEVLIDDDTKIRVKKDTIVINIADFKNNTEVIAEDILAKLPGIEVTEDGKIKANGKPIEKILIEGDDLFDSNYKMLTKTLGANDLDKVEILNNYSDNPLMKGIKNTESVALNFVLKEDRKNIIFGNATLGYGVEDKYYLKGNVISFTKPAKLYFVSNLNNTGENSSDLYNGFNGAEVVLSSKNNFQKQTSNFVSLNSINSFNFKQKYVNNNKAFGNSLNFTTSSKKKRVIVRGMLSYYKDEIKQNKLQETVFQDENNEGIRENYKYKNKPSFGGLETDVTINTSKKSRLKYSLKAGVNDNSDVSNYNLDNSILAKDYFENLDSKPKYQHHHLNFTQKINLNSVLQFHAYFGENEREQNYYLKPSENNNSEENSLKKQEVFNKINYYGTKTSFVKSFDKSNLQLDFEYQHEDNNLTSNLSLPKNSDTIINYLNKDNYLNNQLDFSVNYSYKIKKRIRLKTNLKTSYINHEFSSEINDCPKKKEDFVFVSPSVRLNIGMFHFSYNYDRKKSGINDLFSNYILQNNRNFTKGYNDFASFYSHNYTFGFSQELWRQQTTFYANTMYSKSNKSYGNDIKIEKQISFLNKTLSDGGSFLMGTLGFRDYNSTLDIAYNFNASLFYNESKSEFSSLIKNDLTNINSNYRFRAISYFESFFNFKFEINYSENRFKSENDFWSLESKNSIIKTNTKLIFSSTKKLKFIIENDNICFDNDKEESIWYHFLNLSANYNLKKNTLFFELTAQNLLNEEMFSDYSVSEYQNVYTVYNLIPTYVMLKTTFRF